MPQSRIDHLRELLASVGQEQIAYWRFFHPFSERLERELGEYLGDPTSVALSCPEGTFSFDQGSYRQSGLGFKNGKFVVPLMFRLRNLRDEGETLIRVHLLCTLEGENLVAQFEDHVPVSVASAEIEPLLKYIYKHLLSICGKSAWFANNPSHYQGTGIGFIRPLSECAT
jgi:hypothetical protein